MAKPQLENGHFRIASEIADALAKTNLSAYESRVLWCIFRKTYGWNRCEDNISYTQFEEATGINRWHIARTLSLLVERRIITRTGEGRHIIYKFQKDYEQWRDSENVHASLPKGVTEAAIESDSPVVEPESLPKGVTEEPLPSGDTSLPKGEKSLPKGVTTSLPKGVNTIDMIYTIPKTLGGGMRAGAHEATTATGSDNFQIYVNEIKKTFNDVDFESEFQKFNLYWKAQGKCDNPKAALYRWMVRARDEKTKGVTHGRTERGTPGQRPSGAFAGLEGYKHPDDA